MQPSDSLPGTMCHRVDKSYYKANTRRHIVPGKLSEGCMYGPFQDAVSVDENSHGAAKSVSIRSSAFCGTCHDVYSPEGIRLEEAFSEWQNSPAARNQQTCQHCHMGRFRESRSWNANGLLVEQRWCRESILKKFRCDRFLTTPLRDRTTRCFLTRSFHTNSTGCTKPITAVQNV